MVIILTTELDHEPCRTQDAAKILNMRLYIAHLIDMICRVLTNNFVISFLYIITVQRALPPEDVEMEPSNVS